MARRVSAGLVLGALTLGVAWIGGLAFVCLLALALVLALNEFYSMSRRAGVVVHRWTGLLAGAAMVFAYAYEPRVVGLIALVGGLWLLALALRPPAEGRLVGLAYAVFGVVYVFGLGTHLWSLRHLEDGRGLFLLTLLATWAADTGAFFVGVQWGKRKLVPHVSPAKTLEGFLGGWGLTVAVVALAGQFLAPGRPLGQLLLAGGVLGIVCPLGDLLESLIKRNLHAKDASTVIPGHGGVLDRIDSLLLAGPVAYALFRFVFP